MTPADVIEVDPEKMGGTPVFFGTRVPIKNFFDYLEGSNGVEIFLDHFPTVEPEQVFALFTLIKDRLGLPGDED
jgi:uncharacterized protein (DUF433 family)